jgi:hypothetical protein
MDQDWLARHGHKTPAKGDAKARTKPATPFGVALGKTAREGSSKKKKTR